MSKEKELPKKEVEEKPPEKKAPQPGTAEYIELCRQVWFPYFDDE